MFCPKCGQQVEEDSMFCQNCGAALSKDRSRDINKFSLRKRGRGYGNPMKGGER
jgi:uncharacterized membrane protein YvbJ